MRIKVKHWPPVPPSTSDYRDNHDDHDNHDNHDNHDIHDNHDDHDNHGEADDWTDRLSCNPDSCVHHFHQRSQVVGRTFDGIKGGMNVQDNCSQTKLKTQIHQHEVADHNFDIPIR